MKAEVGIALSAAGDATPHTATSKVHMGKRVENAAENFSKFVVGGCCAIMFCVFVLWLEAGVICVFCKFAVGVVARGRRVLVCQLVNFVVACLWSAIAFAEVRSAARARRGRAPTGRMGGDVRGS